MMGFFAGCKHLILHPGVAKPKYRFLICCVEMYYKASLREETQFRNRRPRKGDKRETEHNV